MCEGEAFAISRLGSIDGIDKISAKSLYLYYKSIIVSSPIDIYICGDADANALAEKIKKYTGSMPNISDNLRKESEWMR